MTETAGFRDLAAFHRSFQVLLVHKLARRHLDIESAVGCAHCIVGRVPIGHQRALELPLVAKDFRVEVVILCRVFAVDEVIAVHHRAHVRFRYGSFESGHVDFAERALADNRV